MSEPWDINAAIEDKVDLIDQDLAWLERQVSLLRREFELSVLSDLTQARRE